MSKMKKLALASLVAGSLVSGSAFAQTDFTSVGTVTTIIPNNANGNVLFAISGTAANPNSCPNAGFLIEAASVGARTLQASILTAFAAGSTVTVGLSSTACSAEGFPVVDGIIMTPAP